MTPKTVLIVEDDYLIALDLQMMLEALGWRVVGPVASVEAALQLLEGELPSVALLDVNLGRELVTPVAESLRASGVPFALASAYDRPEDFGGDVLTGRPNVGKPISEGRLLTVLRQLAGS